MSTLSDIINRSKTDFQSEIPEYDSTLPNSLLTAILISNSGRFKELYGQVDLLKLKLLLLDSSGDFLDAWGSIFNIIRKVATKSSGNIIITGNNNTVIPSGTEFSSDSGLIYTSQNSDSITYSNRSVAINVNDLVATVTLNDHGLATGMTINISGATNIALNGYFVITVVDEDTFNYSIQDNISNGDYGSANASVSYATIEVESNDYGSDTVVSSGSSLSLVNTITGVDNLGYPTLSGVIGGDDVESDDDYKDRVLFRVRNPISDLSISGIKNILYDITGITRAWVRSITPDVGKIKILFVRDNDDDIFPDATRITEARDAIPTPAFMEESDISVIAPTEQSIDFEFSSITPDTFNMRQSIQDNLEQFFRESMDIGIKLSTANTITDIEYLKPIINAIDKDTGQRLQSYTLTSPTGDISVADDNLPTLGEVTF